MNFEQAVIEKLQAAIVAAGGTIVVPNDTNFQQYLLYLLDQLGVAITGIGGGGGSDGLPTPIVALPYTFNQSNDVINSGSYATLTDGLAYTGAVSHGPSGSGIKPYLEADLGEQSYVNAIAVAGGNVGGDAAGSGGTSTANYLNTMQVLTSLDGTIWSVAVPSISGIVDTVNAASLTLFTIGGWARYVRIYRPSEGYIGTSEFRVFGYNQSSAETTIDIPTITTLQFTASQSSVYYTPTNTDCIGTYANLNDGNSSTGAGTSSAANQWISADLYDGTQMLRYVNSVAVAAGSLGGGFQGTAAYLMGKELQVSADGLYWNKVATIGFLSDSDPTLSWYNVGSWCRYVRLFSPSSYLGTTALVVRGY